MNNEQNPSILKVLSVEKRRDSRINDEQPDGRLYKYIRVETVGDRFVEIPGVGRVAVKGESRTSAFIAYPNNYLDQKDSGADLQKGQFVMGDIVTREVEPYQLVGNDGVERTITQYSCVVLGDSTKTEQWEATINRTFSRRGHTLAGESVPVAVNEEASEAPEVEVEDDVSEESAV